MLDLALPAFYAVLLWWAGTGVVLYLDGMRRERSRWNLGGATVVALLALYGLRASAGDTSIGGAYLGFTCGLLVWAWQEMAFLTGAVTGSWRQPCPAGLQGWPRFVLAVKAIIHHEVAILIGAVLVVAAGWGGENQVGAWTYCTLWIMRLSAKLNVFFGVRNVSAEFLPLHLRYLGSFFARKPINWLLPLPITLGSVAATMLVLPAATGAVSEGEAAGRVLLASLVTLAVLEHWMLVLPISVAAMWRWGFRSRAGARRADVVILTGFPGAGRSTVIERILGHGDLVLASKPARLMGHDSVLELGLDVAAAMEHVIAARSPKRLLIKPDAFADTSALFAAMRQAEVQPLLGVIRTVFVVDAANFRRDHVRMGSWFAQRCREADEVLLNQADRVTQAELDSCIAELRAMTPRAAIRLAVHGEQVPSGAWVTSLAPNCDRAGLEAVLAAVAGGAFGQVDRLQGVAQAGQGWVEFFVAAGRPGIASIAPRADETPRVVAVGKEVDGGGLSAAFAACAVPVMA